MGISTLQCYIFDLSQEGVMPLLYFVTSEFGMSMVGVHRRCAMASD